MANNDVSSATPSALVNKGGQVTIITLNRPRVLNAINTEMVALMSEAVLEAQNDGTKVIVIAGAGERGLSGGGDIKAMAANGAEHGANFIEVEYELDLQIAVSKVPVIALMHGITMGGGIGISGHSELRIVTETSVLAMPEAKIGIVPDVGGNLLLSKAPGRLGEYLALTAGQFNAHDAIELGFADLLIPNIKLDQFVEALKIADFETVTPYEVAESFAKPTSTFFDEKEITRLQRISAWADQLIETALNHSSEVTVATVLEPGALKLAEWAVKSLANLIELAEQESQKEVVEFAQTLRQMSPTALAVAIAQIARTRALDLGLKEVLEDDLRVLTRMFLMPDFVEGVRALVIDKDKNPVWVPQQIEQLDAVMVARVLDPLG